jgi:hypothetical protein
MTGNKKQHIDLVIENYGNVKNEEYSYAVLP